MKHVENVILGRTHEIRAGKNLIFLRINSHILYFTAMWLHIANLAPTTVPPLTLFYLFSL